MADSVTPPSSPFGQPAAPPAERPPLIVPIKQPEGESYGARFRFAYVGLALVVGAAVAVLVVVLLQGRPAAGPHWSTWKPPSGSRLDQAAAIAGHVAPEYRLTTGGAELVAVQAHAPEIQNVPVEAVVVRGASGSSQDYKITSTKNAVSYVLCGLGTRCAITSGTPTVARARLLRREALELALYTFRYVNGIDSVVTFLPPNPAAKANQQTSSALYFRKSQYSQQYKDTPLADTLPGRPRGELLPAQQASLVDKLTYPALYNYQLENAGDGSSGVLILSPLIPQS